MPGAPTGLSAAPANQQVTVSWTPPGDGGSAITSYTVTPILGGVPLTARTVFPPDTSVTVTGLSNGLSYTFNVSATNAIGTGPVSTSSPVVPVPLGQPNNTASNAQSLGSLGCGQSESVSGIAANDGSNAWYTVTFTGPALFSTACTPHVNLGSSFGPVFDIYLGSPASSPLAQGTTSWSPNASLTIGASQLYYIHIYDPEAGAPVARFFSLGLNNS